jgi:hypothetical protein
MNILIFRTNINSKRDYLMLKVALANKFYIEVISIDFEDCDKAIRVLNKRSSQESITNEVKIHLFFLKA